MLKSKLLPRSGSSLEAVEPHSEKGAIKFWFFLFTKFVNVNIHFSCEIAALQEVNFKGQN